MTYRFIACSDLHIRPTAPENRVDNFYETQKRKMRWLFKTAKEASADIICGGDVFDSPTVPYSVTKEYVRMARNFNVRFLTVFGQHDLRYHAYKSYPNTPLSVMLSSLRTEHLDRQPFENDEVCVQGTSWDMKIPSIVPGKVNILAIHQMVTENGGLWPGHTDYTLSKDLTETSGFDIVVSGDNHQSFATEHNGRYLFNSGSIVRLTKAQYDTKPRVALVTVKDGAVSYEWIPVPIKAAEKVFSDFAEHDKADTEANEQLQAFSAQLSEYKVDKPDFVNNLTKAAKSVDDESVGDVINVVLQRVQVRV